MTDFIALIKASPVVLGMVESTPKDVISRLVDSCVEGGCISADARDSIFEAVWQREQVGSTALTSGIAFPHARTNCVQKMISAIGIHQEGLPFGSLDNGLTRIFILLVEPTESATHHIRFFSLLSQRLLDERIRERLLIAKTRDEVLSIICPPPPTKSEDANFSASPTI